MKSLDYRYENVRTAAILTGAYVAGTVLLDCEQHNQLVVHLKFTIGSLTSCDIKVEFSHDNTTWYQETASAVSGGTSTESLLVHRIAATGNYRLAIPIKDAYVRISAIGNGTATSSSLKVDVVIGQA